MVSQNSDLYGPVSLAVGRAEARVQCVSICTITTLNSVYGELRLIDCD